MAWTGAPGQDLWKPPVPALRPQGLQHCPPHAVGKLSALVPTCREPAREAFTLRTTCLAYGNEPMTDTVYSGVALLLKVGAAR